MARRILWLRLGSSPPVIMKNCNYCGKSNEENLLFCLGCGTSLYPAQEAVNQKSAETLSSASDAPRLDARLAIRILAAVLVAQLIAGLLVGVIGGVALKVQGNDLHDARQVRHLIRTLTEPMVALATVAGGAAMLLTSRSLTGEKLTDRSPTGAAWIIGSPNRIAIALAIGVLMGVCYAVAAILWMGIFGQHRRVASTPLLLQLLGICTALVLAPATEEPLFRGLLYGGFRRSFGSIWAALLTTFIFCIMHVEQMIQFPPAFVGIAGVALSALWIRLRSAAIGPAIAVHFAYNASVAALSAISSRYY